VGWVKLALKRADCDCSVAVNQGEEREKDRYKKHTLGGSIQAVSVNTAPPGTLIPALFPFLTSQL